MRFKLRRQLWRKLLAASRSRIRTARPRSPSGFTDGKDFLFRIILRKRGVNPRLTRRPLTPWPTAFPKLVSSATTAPTPKD